MFSYVLACAVCFGSHDPRITMVLVGMLFLPFVIVGGMFSFLYYKGVFATATPENTDDSNAGYNSV